MEDETTEMLFRIGLTMIPGIGDVLSRRLIAYFGSAGSVFAESKRALLKVPGIGPAIAEALKGKDVLHMAERELQYIRKMNIRLLFYPDKDYPQRLKSCPDAPLILYIRGDEGFQSARSLAVVGTRSATAYGRDAVKDIISGLSRLDVTIISGLAYGIDTSAHKAALENNMKTVAVLAHGLDRIYPPPNFFLAKDIMKHGSLVTEFPTGIKPDRENFPRRNRIIAGLSDAVLVAEAAERGGALITADIANTYNRDVFALPGRNCDRFSKGCNWLIKTNRAALVESAADIIENMQWDQPPAGKGKQCEMNFGLTEDEIIVVEFLKANNNSTIDEICKASLFSPSKAAAVLLNLEFSGLVKCLPGKSFSLIL